MKQVRHVLEDYQLDRVLSSSARTTVFRALDPATGRPVAIKLIHPAGPTIQETNRSAFLYAAEVARTGVIGGLPRIVDFGLTIDDNAFLVMDMVDLAVPVSELGDSSPRRLLSVARGLATALDTLAMSGAVHLNLRPDNVLVTAHDTVLLSGYGTAAFLAGAPSGVWPEPDDPWVAPELSAPDALRTVDLVRADVYSLTRVICGLLSAEIGSETDGTPKVTLDPNLSHDAPELAAALTAGLSPRPEARGVSVSDIARKLVEADSRSADAAFHGGLDPAAFETRAITSPIEFEETPPISVDAVGAGVPPKEGPPPAGEEPEPDAATGGGPPFEVRDDHAGRALRWDIIAPLAAAVVVVAVVTALLLTRSRPGEAVAPATPVQVAAPARIPTPSEAMEPAINPLLEQAEKLLLDGDVDQARRLLRNFPEQLVASFGAEERELYDGLLGSIESDNRDQAVADLMGGLEHGSVRMLRRGLSGLADLPAEERASIPDLEANLARARTAIRLHNELGEAERAGAHLVVMDRADEMIELLPGYSRSYALKENAAVALQTAAEDAIAKRDFLVAVKTLTALEERWPGREGVVDRISWCERQQLVDEELETVLRNARAAGQRGDPEAGLGMLDGASPQGPHVARFGALRMELEARLSEMDAGVPTISLDPAFDPAFKKNETVVVPLTVTDDFRVERVSAWVGTGESQRYQEVVLQPAADGTCPLEITPEMHGNRTVFFFVMASDPAGHQVYLGSPDAPYEIERKKWFNKVIP